MQGPIAQALALTAVGNAFLGGRDIAGFWPDASVFRFSKACEFLKPDATALHGFKSFAADPVAWFAMSKQEGVHGFRLHAAPRPRGPNQTIEMSERMSVGFVGGGPRWLIEAVGPVHSEIWEGFDRLGDRDDPAQKIWLNAYLMQGETVPQALAHTPVAQAIADLSQVLPEIEALAREEGSPHFAECFERARAALASADAEPGADHELVAYAGLAPNSVRLLAAIECAWVFGGMGSWNDGVGDERHEEVSDDLFGVLIDGIVAVANATYRF